MDKKRPHINYKLVSLLRRSAPLRLLLRTYARFLKIRGNSREIALGFALGLFIAVTPTMGIQIPLAIFIAALFKWSKISAAVGVWLTNPLSAPFVYGLTYYIGAKILGLRTLRSLTGDIGLSTVIEALKKAPELLSAMTVGGILIGIPLAVVGYYLSYAAIEKYQNDLKVRMQQRKERGQQRRGAAKASKKTVGPSRRKNKSLP